MIVSAVLIFAFAAIAEPISQLHPTDYVNDFAHVLNQTPSRKSMTSAAD